MDIYLPVNMRIKVKAVGIRDGVPGKDVGSPVITIPGQGVPLEVMTSEDDGCVWLVPTPAAQPHQTVTVVVDADGRPGNVPKPLTGSIVVTFTNPVALSHESDDVTLVQDGDRAFV